MSNPECEAKSVVSAIQSCFEDAVQNLKTEFDSGKWRAERMLIKRAETKALELLSIIVIEKLRVANAGGTSKDTQLSSVVASTHAQMDQQGVK